MRDLIGAIIVMILAGGLTAWLLISDKKRHSLFPDDGIVWNTEIEKRMKRQRKGKQTV